MAKNSAPKKVLATPVTAEEKKKALDAAIAQIEKQKTTYSMQKVYDEATGSYVYKVVADKKDANVNRSLTKKKMYRKFMYEAEAATKAKAMEDADDNDAVNAASAVESSGERLYDFAMEHSKSATQRKYDRLSKAQKKMAKADAIYAKRKFQYD